MKGQWKRVILSAEESKDLEEISKRYHDLMMSECIRRAEKLWRDNHGFANSAFNHMDCISRIAVALFSMEASPTAYLKKDFMTKKAEEEQ